MLKFLAGARISVFSKAFRAPLLLTKLLIEWVKGPGHEDDQPLPFN